MPAIQPFYNANGTEKLRITITATKEFDDLARLLEGVHLFLLYLKKFFHSIG